MSQKFSQKIIVITAPSGVGKSTLCKYLLQVIPDLEFSISCATRNKRAGEVDGVDYYFRSLPIFLDLIQNEKFVEHEEVHPGKWYGTLHSEINRIMNNHHHVIMDVDVKGAEKIKKSYPDSKIIFIIPPSMEVLEQRLRSRNDTPLADIERRFKKAPIELEFGHEMASQNVFDLILKNDDLETTKTNIVRVIQEFLGQGKRA